MTDQQIPETKCWHCAQDIRLIDGEWLDRETHSDCECRVKGKHVPTPSTEPSVPGAASSWSPELQQRCRAAAGRLEDLASGAGDDVTVSSDVLMEAASLILGYDQSLLIHNKLSPEPSETTDPEKRIAEIRQRLKEEWVLGVPDAEYLLDELTRERQQHQPERKLLITCLEILEGLRASVQWELAPSIMALIERVTDEGRKLPEAPQ